MKTNPHVTRDDDETRRFPLRTLRMRTLPLLVAVSLASALGACRQNDAPDEASALLTTLEAEPYREWARAPGYASRTPSDAPHSDEVEIFVNDVVVEALGQSGLEAWPVGAQIVKEGYDADGALDLIAVMEKRDDGWFFAEYDADGEPLYSGAPTICTDCHASGGDYVRAFALP